MIGGIFANLHLKLCHRFLLSTRSAHLRAMFEGKWRDRAVVTLGHRQVTCRAFRLLLEYLYTGQVCWGFEKNIFN